MLTSTALVFLPQSAQSAQAVGTGTTDSYTATQEIVAGGSPVLSKALPSVRPAMSLDQLRGDIQIGSPTSNVLSVTAKGSVAADVEATANAVAQAYISYVNSPSSPVGKLSVQLIQPASPATRPSLLKVLVLDALLGVVVGALVGVISALAVSRRDRRLRERDEIAHSIGVPVLASLPVNHPADTAEWTSLLADYQPGVVHAWRLHQVLQLLGMPGAAPGDGALSNGNQGDRHDDGFSLTVLSISTDRNALALGPHLAAFAASQGISTALVIGPPQEPDATAMLRAAGAAASGRPSRLRVIVSDGHVDQPPSSDFIVVVAVVDSHSPHMPATMRTSATVLGVSAGAATADQLARAAMSAAVDGREVSGVLVADPEPTDRTTGRVPQLPQQQLRLPTRTKRMTTEIRR